MCAAAIWSTVTPPNGSCPLRGVTQLNQVPGLSACTGGAIAGLLEFAAFTTLGRALEDERVAMKPITVTVDYMRGGTDRETYATAMIERLGTRIANVEAVAWQKERSSPIASARLNFLLERPDQ